MAEVSTLARPYAKAAFGSAQGANAVDAWSAALSFLAQVSVNPEGRGVLAHPSLSAQQKADWLNGLSSDSTDSVKQFVSVLAENQRLELLSEISEQFEELRRQLDSTAVAQVESAMDMSESQQASLAEALARHLNKQVSLEVTVNPELVGGVVIRADDLVIDGSVRGKVAKLAEQLKP